MLLLLRERNIMHPLSPDLTSLSNDELHKKIGELQQRLIYAGRAGSGEIIYQLQLLLNDYKNEADARNRKALEELESKSKNFKNIIDIK